MKDRGRWLKLFRINWTSQWKENINVPENGGDNFVLSSIMLDHESRCIYETKYNCWYSVLIYVSEIYEWLLTLSRWPTYYKSLHLFMTSDRQHFTLRFEVVFYQSCHLTDNFKHLAEEVGRCYTIGCPSACTMITGTWSIEKKFIEFLDLFSGYMKGYWYYPSDLHEILFVLS